MTKMQFYLCLKRTVHLTGKSRVCGLERFAARSAVELEEARTGLQGTLRMEMENCKEPKSVDSSAAQCKVQGGLG